jgi:hypothetical protein
MDQLQDERNDHNDRNDDPEDLHHAGLPLFGIQTLIRFNLSHFQYPSSLQFIPGAT